MQDKTSDIKTLTDLLQFIPENHKPIAKKLIDRLKFMDRTLNKLQSTISKEGAVITAINGNGFETTIEHPAQKSYTALIGKYNAMAKTFIDLVPSGSGTSDEFIDFVKPKK